MRVDSFDEDAEYFKTGDRYDSESELSVKNFESLEAYEKD